MRTPPDDPGGEVVLRAVGSAIMSGGIFKKDIRIPCRAMFLVFAFSKNLHALVCFLF